MFTRKKLGDREITYPAEIPESTRQLLNDVMEQNRMVLEMNQKIITQVTMGGGFIALAPGEKFEQTSDE